MYSLVICVGLASPRSHETDWRPRRGPSLPVPTRSILRNRLLSERQARMDQVAMALWPGALTANALAVSSKLIEAPKCSQQGQVARSSQRGGGEGARRNLSSIYLGTSCSDRHEPVYLFQVAFRSPPPSGRIMSKIPKTILMRSVRRCAKSLTAEQYVT